MNDDDDDDPDDKDDDDVDDGWRIVKRGLHHWTCTARTRIEYDISCVFCFLFRMLSYCRRETGH